MIFLGTLKNDKYLTQKDISKLCLRVPNNLVINMLI